MQIQGLSNAVNSSIQVQGELVQNRPSKAPQEAVGGQTTAAVQATAKAQSEQKVDREDVSKAVERLNSVVSSFNRSLQFSIDEDTKLNVVRLVDVQSKETIRQIPSEEALSIAKAIDKLQGLLIQDKA